MAGSKFLKKKKPPGLMLTSLLDMFTIILIFLLVSFEAEDYEFQLNDDIELPESRARSVFKPAINMAITPKAVVIEKRKIVDLNNGKLAQKYYDQDEVPEVVEVMERAYEVKFADATPEQLESDDTGPIILVQADKDLDYRTLFLVLKSAGKAGFVKYRLVITKV